MNNKLHHICAEGEGSRVLNDYNGVITTFTYLLLFLYMGVCAVRRTFAQEVCVTS